MSLILIKRNHTTVPFFDISLNCPIVPFQVKRLMLQMRQILKFFLNLRKSCGKSYLDRRAPLQASF